MRSIFSAGLLEGFLDKQFNPFDFVIGVSAGCINLVNYISQNKNLGLPMYMEAASSREFINYRRFFKGGDLINLDWIYQKLITAQFSKLFENDTPSTPMYVCVTSVFDGNARYIRLTQDNYANSIKASCALPVFYRKFPLINNSSMIDGGIADGIPVIKAMSLGANRIMVVRSRSHDYVKTDTLWHKYIRWKLRAYPALARTLKMRIDIFNDTLNIIRQPPKNIRIIEICPPSSFTCGRFNTMPHNLNIGYDHGYQAADQAISDWKKIG